MPGRGFVELLYADAPPDAYEQLVRDAAEAGADEVTLAALRAELDTALRVREQWQRLRRREAELSALYETAHDLTAIRDVDAVLLAITRRARHLLGADITYLSLNDVERGDSFIRVTDGAVSVSFRGLRLPLGTGLLGLVAETGLPYATDDYFGDDRFVHREAVDDAVADEGIRAILGVPLLLGDQVIGTLCAAHRSPRPFPPDEVALLQSFAAHAAIALDNARMFEETRQAGEQMRMHSRDVELAAQAHDRLTEVLLTGADAADRDRGLHRVAAVVAEVLGASAWVLDADGRTVAGPVEQELPLAADLAREVSRADGDGRTVRTRAADGGSVWLVPARAGTDQLATLVLHGPEQLPAAHQRTLERAALVAALVVLFSRSVTEAEDRVRGEVLGDLLTGAGRQPAALRERGLRHGADLDRPHVVLVVRTADADRQRATAVASRVAADHRGLAGRPEGDLALVLPGEDAADIGRQVHTRLAELGIRGTVGVAGPVCDAAAYPAAWAEARQCLATLLALGREGEVADPTALGLTRLLLGTAGPAELNAFLDRALGPVVRYDARRGTELVGTLESWCAGGNGLAEAGRRLHVHPNTVAQRLDRVGELLGPGWREPERLLELQLALRVHRLRAERVIAGE